MTTIICAARTRSLSAKTSCTPDSPWEGCTQFNWSEIVGLDAHVDNQQLQVMYGNKQVFGNECAGVWNGTATVPATLVTLSTADYDILRSHMSGVTTSDVALLTSAVMLIWAIAWLWKRAVRVLIPNA